MRLIDADALKERYENTTDCALVCIDEAPTLDMRPNIHGHWKMDEDDYRICATEFTCSVCGETFCSDELSDKEFLELMRFCSNCGAKMDEVTDNE